MVRIKELEEVSNLSNIEICILSICRKDFQINEKNEWLDRYAPYFKKENRFIISKESKEGFTSAEIKADFLEEFKTDKQKVFVDDDNMVLKKVGENIENIIIYQDSELDD